jgi:cysteinyl-tRNA synthetase
MDIILKDNLSQQQIHVQDRKQKIKIFNCGPTVSDYIHVGHLRNALLPDLLIRVMSELGWGDVVSLCNVTNISNKIYKRSKQEKSLSWVQIGDQFTRYWQEDLLSLNIYLPHIIMPDTRHVQGIIKFTESLLDMKAAYIKEGTVYFDCDYIKPQVDQFHDYNLPIEKGLLHEIHQNTEDFILWESVTSTDEMVWDSPWGIGRPGKHIPCSNVIETYCDHNDLIIHCGGDDLLYHHSCEFSQNLAHSNNATVSDIWLHNALIHVNGQKMGKSLGNSKTVRELLLDYKPNTLRWYLLNTNYDSILEYDPSQIEQVQEQWNRIENRLSQFEIFRVEDEAYYQRVMDKLADNLNTRGTLLMIEDAVLNGEGNEQTLKTSGYILNMLGFRMSK